MTQQPLTKVIKEKAKRRLKVFGLFKSEEEYSRKTTIISDADVPRIIDGSAERMPDDIIRDISPEEVSDLPEE